MRTIPLPIAGLLIMTAGLASFLIAGSRDRSEAERAFAASRSGSIPTPLPANSHPPATKKDFAGAVAEIIEDRNRLRRTTRLHNVTALLTAEEMPAALNLALGMDPRKRAMLLGRLLDRWAELDVEAAARYELALPTEISRSFVTNPLKRWAAQDFAAASAAVLALPEGEQRKKALRTIAHALSETDPLTAVRFAEQHGAGPLGAGLRRERRSWSAKDFEAAANYGLSMAEAKRRESTIYFLVEAHAIAAPQQVLNWARGINDEKLRDKVIDRALSDWARRNPYEALAYARALPAGELRERAFSNVVRRVAQDDVSAAQRLVEELPAGRAREGAMGTLISTLEQKDTSAAVRLVLSVPADSFRESALWSLTRKLTGEDSAKAMQFARDLPEGAHRNTVTQWIAEELAGNDPARALEATRLLPPGEQRERTLQSVLYTWVRSEPKAAIEYAVKNPPRGADASNLLGTEALRWAQALPEGKQREELIGVAVGTLDRPAAIKHVATLTGEAQSEAARRIARHWASENPAGAVEWAGTLPEGETRARAFATVIESWAQADATSSAAWLQTLPPGLRGTRRCKASPNTSPRVIPRAR